MRVAASIAQHPLQLHRERRPIIIIISISCCNNNSNSTNGALRAVPKTQKAAADPAVLSFDRTFTDYSTFCSQSCEQLQGKCVSFKFLEHVNT